MGDDVYMLNLRAHGTIGDIKELNFHSEDAIQETYDIINYIKSLVSRPDFNDRADLELDYIEKISRLLYLRNKLAPIFAYQNHNEIEKNEHIKIIDHDFYDPITILIEINDIDDAIDIIAIRKKKALQKNNKLDETIFFSPYLDNNYQSQSFDSFVNEINVQSLKSLTKFNTYVMPTINDIKNGKYFTYYSFVKKSSYRNEAGEKSFDRILRKSIRKIENSSIPQERNNKGYCFFTGYKTKNHFYSSKEVMKTYYEICTVFGDFLGIVVRTDAIRKSHLYREYDIAFSDSIVESRYRRGISFFDNVKLYYIFKDWDDIAMKKIDKFNQNIMSYINVNDKYNQANDAKIVDLEDDFSSKSQDIENLSLKDNYISSEEYIDEKKVKSDDLLKMVYNLSLNNNMTYLKDKDIIKNHLDNKDQENDLYAAYLIVLINNLYRKIEQNDDFYNNVYNKLNLKVINSKETKMMITSIKNIIKNQLIRLGYFYFASYFIESGKINQDDYIKFLKFQKNNSKNFYIGVIMWINYVVTNSIFKEYQDKLDEVNEYIRYVKQVMILCEQLKKNPFNQIYVGEEKISAILNIGGVE